MRIFIVLFGLSNDDQGERYKYFLTLYFLWDTCTFFGEWSQGDKSSLLLEVEWIMFRETICVCVCVYRLVSFIIHWKYGMRAIEESLIILPIVYLRFVLT